MIQQLYLIKQERKYLLDDQEEIKESRIKLENDLKDAILDYKDTKNYLKEIETNSNFISDKINIYDNKILYINENLDEYEQCEEMFKIKSDLEESVKEFKEEQKDFKNKLIVFQQKKKNYLKKIKLLNEGINKIQIYEIYLDERLNKINNIVLMFENMINEQQNNLIEAEQKFEFEKCKFKEISKFKDVIIYESCQICLGDFLDDDDISIFSCNKHILHSQCLNEWMLYEQICPICKTLYSKKQ